MCLWYNHIKWWSSGELSAIFIVFHPRPPFNAVLPVPFGYTKNTKVRRALITAHELAILCTQEHLLPVWIEKCCITSPRLEGNVLMVWRQEALSIEITLTRHI